MAWRHAEGAHAQQPVQPAPYLDLAQKKLDTAVLTAYGWPNDLTDEQILERLLALNLERAEEEPSP